MACSDFLFLSRLASLVLIHYFFVIRFSLLILSRAQAKLSEIIQEPEPPMNRLGFMANMQKITIIGTSFVICISDVSTDRLGSTLNVNYLMSLLCTGGVSLGDKASEKMSYFIHAEILFKLTPFTLDEVRTKHLSKLFLNNPGYDTRDESSAVLTCRLLIYTAASDAANYKVFHEVSRRFMLEVKLNL